MKYLLILAAAVQLAACADMTPMQKRWTAVGISVAATSLLISSGHGDKAMVAGPQQSTQPLNCNTNPESCR